MSELPRLRRLLRFPWLGCGAIAAGLALWGLLRWAAGHPHGGLGWDEAVYVNTALRDWQRWEFVGKRAFLAGFWTDDPARPPAHRLLAVPFSLLSGADVFWLRVSSIAGFALAVALMGALAWHLVRTLARTSGRTLARTSGQTSPDNPFRRGSRGRAAATAGAVVALLCLMPGTLHPVRHFYTEAPLFLATALTLAGSLWGWGPGLAGGSSDRADAPDRADAADRPIASDHRDWRQGGFRQFFQGNAARSRWLWAIWGLGLGLGLLAKASFALLAAGAMGVAFGLRLGGWVAGPALWEFFAAGGLGVAIALPWWLRNGKTALAYSRYASNFAAHSLGAPWAPATVGQWLLVVAQVSLGLGVTVLGLAVLAGGGWRLSRGAGGVSPRLGAIAVCLGGCLLLPLASLSSLNHNPRLVAPMLFPLALAIALGVDGLGWTGRRAAWLAIAPLAVQGVVLFESLARSPRLHERSGWLELLPVRTAAMRPVTFNGVARTFPLQPQWDWGPTMAAMRSRGLADPAIAYVLTQWQVSPPEIQYPWLRATRREPVVTPLLSGPVPLAAIDWGEVEAIAARQDAVVALAFLKDRNRDLPEARINRAFVERFSRRSDFAPPVRVPLLSGDDPPIAAIVFFKRRRSALPGE